MSTHEMIPVARMRPLLCGSLAALLLVAAGACGDDGGGGTGDGLAPAVAVAFPPPVSLTDATTITIRGRAEDPDGVAAVRVNGVLAETGDEFAEWRATVTLSHGNNTIVIAGEDSLGFIDEQAATVLVTLSANWLDVPTAVVADAQNGRALVLDRVLDAVLSVDYATGERIILSGDNVGDGPRLMDPMGLVHDVAGDRVLVVDRQLNALVAVALGSGTRTILSDDNTGAGPGFDAPHAMTADIDAGVAWVLSTGVAPLDPVPVIVAVDLDTGDRTVLESALSGAPPVLGAPAGALVFDGNAQALYVAATDLTDPLSPMPTIYRVDLATAEAGALLGLNPEPLIEPVALAFDAATDTDTLYVLDAGDDSILSMSLDTGLRTVVARDGVSMGQDFSVPVALAVDPLGGVDTRLLVVDTGIDELLAVDIDTGTRTVISEVALGAGPVLGRPVALIVDAPAVGGVIGDTIGRVVLVDNNNDAIVAVDLATGARTVLSDDQVGTGDPLQNPVAMATDMGASLYVQEQAVARVFVVDEGADAIIAVDLATGARTQVSGPQVGAGDPFTAPRALVFWAGDPTQGTEDRLLVADDDQGVIMSVDLDTGDRTTLTDSDPANGPVLGKPQALAVELDAMGVTGRLLVADEDPPALLAVDLDTGARTVLTGLGVGDGVAFEAPLGVAMELAAVPRDPHTDPPAGEPVGPDFAPTGYALVVHGGGTGALYAVELANGRRTEIQDAAAGLGPMLDSPQALTVDPMNQRLVMVDAGMEAVLMIDLRTGERVLVSR